MEIQAASLDDPSWIRPVVDIFTARAQLWNPLNSALLKFATQPTADQWQELSSAHGK